MSKTIRAPLALAVALVWGVGAAQLASAATVVWLTEADFLPPPISDTRDDGEVTFLADGLHVQTTSTTSEAKAAEYLGDRRRAADVGFADLVRDRQPTVACRSCSTLTERIRNGNDFNILVGEPNFYGDNWWLTPASSDDAKAADPSGADNSGNGSEWFGTLAEWEAAMPQCPLPRRRLLPRLRRHGRRRHRQHHLRRHGIPIHQYHGGRGRQRDRLLHLRKGRPQAHDRPDEQRAAARLDAGHEARVEDQGGRQDEAEGPAGLQRLRQVQAQVREQLGQARGQDPEGRRSS